MSLPDHLAGLADPAAYPHPAADLEVVETHVSWVILTGEFAYKLKKPVRFSFVDFSTLERRRHFCEEELRCNRRFAPSLYLGVVAVVREASGALRIGEPSGGAGGEIVEWAVQMRRFPAGNQLDRLLASHGLDAEALADFGRRLAEHHRGLPRLAPEPGDLERRVLAPVRENFSDLAKLDWTGPHRPLLGAVQAATERWVTRQRTLLTRRLEDGWVRECHGDLHLSNLVMLEEGITAFDCLEFNADLRWIDTQSDVAFLFMDCLVRDRADLAYAFVDGYLDVCGDYDGARLLPFYAAYRAMVRAKVAALRSEQADQGEAAPLRERFRHYAEWAGRTLERPPGRLLLMCGLSGSGKSYVAERLAPRLPALRLRSDVARKVRAGLQPSQRAEAGVGDGIYAAEVSDAVYGWLADVARDLVAAGEQVIVDATFLTAARRRPLLEAAQAAGGRGVILWCDAPFEVLAERVRARAARQDDPSDAGLEVLEDQTRRFEPPRQQVLRVDTRGALDVQALVARLARSEPR